ncbi:MAG: TetR family transcriptional regulator [Solirubrobacteraceae bacterium]
MATGASSLAGRRVAVTRASTRVRLSGERGQSASVGRSRPVGQVFEREDVGEIQRSRLLSAAARVVSERGTANVTVARIVERAGVSRRTFYELYRDCEECLLDVFADALAHARERVLDDWSLSGSWLERTRRALVALLYLFDEDPVLARLLVVESLGAGHRVLADRARVLDGVVDALASGMCHDAPSLTESRARCGENCTDARLSMECALGGVLSVLHARISQHAPGRLIELTSPLMSMLVLPCHGPEAARREAERPTPDPRADRQSRQLPPVFRSDPFKDAGMRLTYRTMRVLCSIDEQPGASNRKIAALAEIGDQGQISKLLSRLERQGIIANTATRASKGEANAWTLTPLGRELTSRINPQAAPSVTNTPTVGGRMTTPGGTQ